MLMIRWLLYALCLTWSVAVPAAEKIKVLLIDGQNNHAWKSTTPVLAAILKNAGIFSVDISTAPPSAPRAPNLSKAASADEKAKHDEIAKKFKDEEAAFKAKSKTDWDAWHPKFSDYSVVVSNYNGENWPEDVRKEFVEFVRNGGGFVSVHAADNAFPSWTEYNEMIGLGGWGGRNEKSGPYLRLEDGKFVKDDKTPGAGGGHGKQHEFVLDTRDPEHPIMKGFPAKWKHATDELYHNLRGPANNVDVLASAYSDKLMNGTGSDQPLLLALSFGKGRVFHTALGHSADTMKGVGFQATFARGTEWAARGTVSLPAPPAEDLPADHVVLRDPLAK